MFTILTAIHHSAHIIHRNASNLNVSARHEFQSSKHAVHWILKKSIPSPLCKILPHAHSEKTNRNYSKSLSKQYPSCHGDHDPLQRRLVIIRNNARNHALNASPPYSNPKYVYCCALRSQKYQHDPKPHLAAKITKITITCATGNLHSKRISSW